ncbi:MAG: malate synthase A [Croceibacter sp.]|jgi:malate synthase|uniref:Malate synthase n=1 Tax=Croceibacter atlanticus (strain ATCC BAA-628 / JCM 21780 / CIP 108009 / IAM 15332 / KCTC 12090 / HTCC2559) TaxID=216432 RepID=A3UAI4_CROAH|nr:MULTISPECIES: malate synthase A [Croceibacter]EAP86820.1 malate synthase [Croceibacter atlanticus HTCC2559]MBG25013.1 malate synthase A [Croceibacter sp.]|tara:strand:+ start:796 stop:2394 length:1599 start_codon:yes stop_codon:yes gene_type:complete
MEHTLLKLPKITYSKDVNNYYPEILTDEAHDFLAALHEKFNGERLKLLNRRLQQQSVFDNGQFPEFPKETKEIRNTDWTAGSIPGDLQDRRVEITGPVDRKMIINALNSGAKTFMADLEDSNAPTWRNSIQGQQNLMDANKKTIKLVDTKRGKSYKLNNKTAVLLVRPRGLHLNEKNILINNEEASGSLVDFGLYVFHNTKTLLENGTAPYFYLPKLEHYLEARWWNEVFTFAQDYLKVPKRTFKATVLVETITASFQLDEIIYELKDHIVGLNCGRWDYIFSYIKKFRNHPNFVVPNRDQVTMTTPFMDAYSKLVIQRCHKRGILAIGGMAAQIPIKNNPEANAVALEKVRKDKEREVKNGHDGTWVAHPALVEIAMTEFNKFMPTPNQLHVTRNDIHITEEDLVEIPKGTVTEAGIRKNINVGILYTEAWLRGHGAVALYNLMEDAATAEISRTQVWQWLKNEVILEDDRKFDLTLYKALFNDEVEKIIKEYGESNIKNTKFELAFELFDKIVLSEKFEEFLTLSAYQYL